MSFITVKVIKPRGRTGPRGKKNNNEPKKKEKCAKKRKRDDRDRETNINDNHAKPAAKRIKVVPCNITKRKKRKSGISNDNLTPVLNELDLNVEPNTESRNSNDGSHGTKMDNNTSSKTSIIHNNQREYVCLFPFISLFI